MGNVLKTLQKKKEIFAFVFSSIYVAANEIFKEFQPMLVVGITKAEIC